MLSVGLAGHGNTVCDELYIAYDDTSNITLVKINLSNMVMILVNRRV